MLSSPKVLDQGYQIKSNTTCQVNIADKSATIKDLRDNFFNSHLIFLFDYCQCYWALGEKLDFNSLDQIVQQLCLLFWRWYLHCNK